MKLVPLNSIFDVEYGNQFDFRKMIPAEAAGVNFISRSSKKYGIVGRVQFNPQVNPYEAGLITVTLGGTYLLTSFIQPSSFYTAQNIKVLRPKTRLSFNEKLYYCICIQKNRYRYSSHGREANVTLDTLLVPAEMPESFGKISFTHILKDFSKPIRKRKLELNTRQWSEFSLEDLFTIQKGERILNRDMQPGQTPCVRATAQNNGITAFIAHEPNHEANTITVSYNGSIGEAFYQEKPFFALDDVNVLYPNGFELNKYTALFLCSLIRKERFRFNYGRKWNLERMNETKIKLPVDDQGKPDFQFMEDFVKQLPYSSSI